MDDFLLDDGFDSSEMVPMEDPGACVAPDVPPEFDISGQPDPNPPPETSEDNTGLLVPMPASAVPVARRVPDPIVRLDPRATKMQRDFVQNSVRDMIMTNAKGAAMVCYGEAVIDRSDPQKPVVVDPGCPYAAKCPLLRVGLPPPVGDDCPVEEAAIRSWVTKNMMELEINPHDAANGSDTTRALQLAGIALQMQRAMWGLAINPKLEQELESVTSDGAVMIMKHGNYNADYLDKLAKTTLKIAEANLTTRRGQVLIAKQGFKDKSKHTAEVAERLRHVTEVERRVKINDKGIPTELTEIHRFDMEREEMARKKKHGKVIDVESTPTPEPPPEPPPPSPPPPVPPPTADPSPPAG